MPQIIRAISQIMLEAGRDMYFVHFGNLPLNPRTKTVAAKQHRAWFRDQGLRTEAAAPEGWLEGDPGILAVHFTCANDPRIAAYAAQFEDVKGKSLSRHKYQMYFYPYAKWAGLRGDLSGEQAADSHS